MAINYESIIDRQIELYDFENNWLGLLEISYETKSEYLPASYYEPADFEFDANITDIKLFIDDSEIPVEVSDNQYSKLYELVTDTIYNQDDSQSLIIDLSYITE